MDLFSNSKSYIIQNEEILINYILLRVFYEQAHLINQIYIHMKEYLTCLAIIAVCFAEFIQQPNYRLGEDLQAGLSDYRKIVLRQNYLHVQMHNANPTKTTILKLYPQFAALTFQQICQKYLTLDQKQPNYPQIEGVKKYQIQDLKQQNSLNFEYVNLAAIYPTPIRNRQNCNSGYALSIVDTIDMFFKSKRPQKKYPSLSTQQLIECSFGFYNNYGCVHGNAYSSYLFIHQYGLVSQKVYPDAFNENYYNQFQKGNVKACSYTNAIRFRIKGFYILGDNIQKHPNDANCASRKSFLRAGYPLTVNIAPDHDFFFYSQGVISNCTFANQIDDFGYLRQYAVMVGFQVSPVYEQNYLILKNIWGHNWGEKGYFRIFDPPECEGAGCYDEEGVPIQQKRYNKCFACNYAYVPSG